MYAVNHAATALPIKRHFPHVGLWPLLISVQAIELLWVGFTYGGIEHIVVRSGQVHLGFLPYSHSVGSTVALAGLVWGIAKWLSRDTRLASALAIGILSHIVLDIIHHEPDIRLLPLAWGPELGLSLTLHPALDAIVETAYAVVCWWVFGGSWQLLTGLLVLNALDLPFMFAGSDAAARIARQPALLTTIVLLQIVLSWTVVWWLARGRATQLAQSTR